MNANKAGKRTPPTAVAHTTDLSKVQMFFFTIVSAVVFLGTADAMFTNMKSIGDVLIPQLLEKLIALMGISHVCSAIAFAPGCGRQG